MEEFEQVFAVDVRGSWLMTKHSIPRLQQNGGGSIVDVSSVGGLVGGSSAPSVYHPTKGSIRMMSKSDAVEYAPVGIRVNSVHPGSTDTMLSRLAADLNPLGRQAHDENVFAAHPLGRRATSEDIAYGVLYFASDESGFVTGTELIIDDGYTAR